MCFFVNILSLLEVNNYGKNVYIYGLNAISLSIDRSMTLLNIQL